MSFVLLSAVCSVLVSVLLKVARRFDIDVAQAVMWNYLAAAVLCALIWQTPLTSLTQPGTPWFALLGLAVVLPSLFLVLAASVRRAGMVRTDIAQRLSLLLSLLAAFFLFGERAGMMKLSGLALGLLAVLGILARPGREPVEKGARALPALLVVWVGFAAVDVMLKQIAAAGTPFAASLQISFTLAFIGMAAWQALRAWRGVAPVTWRNGAAGLLLGLLNFGNIIFYVSAHRALPSQPAVVFASMNIGVVALAALVGALGFGERLSWVNRAAIALAIGAIVLIALAPKGLPRLRTASGAPALALGVQRTALRAPLTPPGAQQTQETPKAQEAQEAHSS
ncbi:MAG: EamA family transporter [Burkholderiaceae bacterium]|jgi:drug/metabolite transporter (DMT)-like permease|nr:EamA family transporter [Burkholderiaceae bacterium]